MRILNGLALGLTLIAGSVHANTITFMGSSLMSATLAGTSPNKLTFVINVGGLTDGMHTATLFAAKMTFVTGLVDNADATVSQLAGLVSYLFSTAGSSRVLLGGASTPAIASTTLMQGIGNGGASLTFLRTGSTENAGTYLIALPPQIVTVNPTLAAYMGIPNSPVPPLLSFAAQFYFNANISAFDLNARIPTSPAFRNFQCDFSLTTVPEPARISLIGLGLFGFAFLHRSVKT